MWHVHYWTERGAFHVYLRESRACQQLTSLLADDASRVDAITFSLPGDKPSYAPDRPADVRHVELDLAFDFDREANQRRRDHDLCSALFEDVREVTLDAAELQIERITIVGHESH